MNTNVPPVTPSVSSSATRSNTSNATTGNAPANTAAQSSTAQNSASATLSQQQAAQQQAQTVTRQTQAQPQSPLPQQLDSQLQSGQPIRATVLPQSSSQPANQAILQTPQGNVTITGNNLPPANSEVTLSLLKQTATNTGVAANAPATATTSGATAGATSGTTSSQQLWQLVWQSATGQIQKASQTTTQQAGTTTPVTTSTLQGSQVTATTLSPNSVGHLLKQPSPLQQGQTQFQTAPSAKSSVATLLNNSNQGPYPPNHNVNLRLIHIQPPGQPPVSSMTLTTAMQATNALQNGFSPFQATVIASTPGQVIVQSSLGPMSFPVQQSLPPGSLITLLPISEPVLSNTASQQAGAGVMLERWAGLKDAMAMLQAGNPQAAQQILQALPQPNNQLPTTLLFLLSTLRGGALENWIGKSTASRISGPAGERITDSLRQSTRQIKDTNGQDWRVFGMPILQDGDMGELWLYLKDKHDEEEDTGPDEETGKRFIIETNFQKMGPLQLDGLATKENIDLMFRSMIPVEQGLREEIRALFIDTVSALGLTGKIAFHVTRDFPVSITEEQGNLVNDVTI